MSDYKKKIAEEVGKTLSGLNQVGDIEADSYFYARLRNKMQADKNNGKSRLLPSHPKFWIKPALVAVLIMLNIFSIVNFMHADDSQNLTRQDYLQSLADDYFQDIGSYSNYLTNE